MAKNPRIIDMTGQTIGNWLVIKQAGNAARGGALWLCKCVCGNEGTPTGADLRFGKSTNCGCIGMQNFRAAKIKHGSSRSRLHIIWKNMKARCADKSRAYYGGRGITVCEEWANDFVVFKKWAEEAAGYNSGLMIERINNDGNYTPDNCTWATRKIQNTNRRFVRRRADGVAWCDVAAENNIPLGLMNGRRHDGWTDEQAATIPRGGRR